MLSSSFSRSAGSLFLLWLASPAAAQKYNLVENWQGKNFIDYFKFYTGADPTNGYVNYVHPDQAERDGLWKITDSGSVYLGVDHKNTLDPHGKGRDSVRIGTKNYYDKSLVIADIAHMPGSVCGTWPAFWSVGRSWPGDGEIDILEGVNLQDHNEVVMHTSGTCSLKDEGMSGAVNATGCGEELGPVGCVIEGEKGSYGTSFNRQGGGVYALEWTDEHLKIWFFPRHSIPPSITSGKPDVTKFGIPMALVKEGCDVANVFKPQSFIFDTTFCGDWAGGVFGNSGCPMTDSDSFQSCHNFVAHNPEQFKETYWEINSVKIYQTGVKGIEVSPASRESATNAPATHESAPEPTVPKHTTHEPLVPEPTVLHPTTQETIAGAAPTSVVSEAPAEVHQSVIVEPVHSTSTDPEAQPVTAPGPAKPKATSTRYLTRYVTSTICNAQAAQSPLIEPPTSWGKGQPADGVIAHQSLDNASPVPSNVEAASQAAKWGPISGNMAISHGPAASSAVHSAHAAQSSPVSQMPVNSASHLPTVKASQHSTPVISKPTGRASPSGSAFRANPTGDSPVFTGAATQLSTKLPALIAVFAVVLLA